MSRILRNASEPRQRSHSRDECLTRVQVSCKTRQNGWLQFQPLTFFVRNLDFHSEQCGRKSLSLRICHERQRSASAQAFMQKKVKRSEIWEFKSFDVAVTNSFEVILHPRGG